MFPAHDDVTASRIVNEITALELELYSYVLKLLSATDSPLGLAVGKVDRQVLNRSEPQLLTHHPEQKDDPLLVGRFIRQIAKVERPAKYSSVSLLISLGRPSARWWRGVTGLDLSRCRSLEVRGDDPEI